MGSLTDVKLISDEYAHIIGGLIFAAKCGDICLTLLVIFSLKVTAKLQVSQKKRICDDQTTNQT